MAYELTDRANSVTVEESDFGGTRRVDVSINHNGIMVGLTLTHVVADQLHAKLGFCLHDMNLAAGNGEKASPSIDKSLEEAEVWAIAMRVRPEGPISFGAILYDNKDDALNGLVEYKRSFPLARVVRMASTAPF